MHRPLTPREQGDRGEFSAMEWLAAQGAHLYLPVGHSPDIDLIAELDGRLSRIEVKTSTCLRQNRWYVLISTRGGNQSWSGLVKYFDPERCDYLFVHVGDGRRWFIPTQAIECRSGLSLGGAKYSEFEIEPGRPLPGEAHLESNSAPGEYRSGQTGGAVNAVSLDFAGSNPASPIASLKSRPGRSQKSLPLPQLEVGHAVIWTKRRMTIPQFPFEAADLKVGDTLRVRRRPRPT